MKKIVILTGAGISAESGIKTFRDADGLWEGHDVMAVASPAGWRRDRELVLEFYNQRRAQLKDVQPNVGHTALVELEKKYEVVIITQNVDDLHERAGSKKIIHLHGELKKSRSCLPGSTDVFDCEGEINLGDKCPKGSQLRPHIVWFGEEVPKLGRATREISSADYVLIIGTSMQVYPAAGLVSYAPDTAKIYYIDPRPTINHELGIAKNLTVVEEVASKGVQKVVEEIMMK